MSSHYPEAGTSPSGISFDYPNGWTVFENYEGDDTGATYDVAVIAPKPYEQYTYPERVYIHFFDVGGRSLDRISDQAVQLTYDGEGGHVTNVDALSNVEDQSLGGMNSRTVALTFDDDRYGKMRGEAHFTAFGNTAVLVEYKARQETFSGPRQSEAASIISSIKFATR